MTLRIFTNGFLCEKNVINFLTRNKRVIISNEVRHLFNQFLSYATKFTITQNSTFVGNCGKSGCITIVQSYTPKEGRQ